MEPINFCYWLQGRAELVKTRPSEEEWRSIVEHLGTVFNKVTQPAPGTSPYEQYPTHIFDYRPTC